MKKKLGCIICNIPRHKKSCTIVFIMRLANETTLLDIDSSLANITFKKS